MRRRTRSHDYSQERESAPISAAFAMLGAIVGTAALLFVLVAVVICALTSCAIEQDVKGLGGTVADYSYCAIAGCGSVFLCDLGSAYYREAPANMHTTTPELCWVDDNADELSAALADRGFADAACEPSPRGGLGGWPCLYGCEHGHRDCNAYQGCYCPN